MLCTPQEVGIEGTMPDSELPTRSIEGANHDVPKSRNPPSKVGHLIIHQLGDGSTDSYNQRSGYTKTQSDKDLDSVPAQQSSQRKTDSDAG